MTLAAIAVLVTMVAGGSIYSYAFADTSNSTNSTGNGTSANSGTISPQDAEIKIKRALIKECRDEPAECRLLGLHMVAASTVQGVKVLGIVEAANDTLAITLGSFEMQNGHTTLNLSSSPVTQSITLVGIASHFNDGHGIKMTGSNVVNPGWTGTTTVDLKLVSNGSINENLFGAHLVRVAAVPFTGP